MDEKWTKAKKIIDVLKHNGYEAYFVGGCVRDKILNINYNDCDITTSALPNEVKSLFQRTIPTGEQYGTISVFMDNELFEVTTFRFDLDYKDHRHPEVRFSTSVSDDVERRDFTINGLLMDENENIFDYVEGQKDLECKLIRAIGNPKLRFQEDALRILRAIHFVSKLGFSIEENTFLAMKEQAFLLSSISIERIQQEMKKITKGLYFKQCLPYFLEISEPLHMKEIVLSLMKHDIDSVSYLAFYGAHYLLDGMELQEKDKLSRAERKCIQEAISCLNNESICLKYNLYDHGMDCMLLAFEISNILGVKFYSKEEIEKSYELLFIKNRKEIVVDFMNYKRILNCNSNIEVEYEMKELELQILNGAVKNTVEDIKRFGEKRRRQNEI